MNMIKMICGLIQKGIMVMLFADFMERRFGWFFPQDVLITYSLYAIQLYSMLQMKVDIFLRQHPELKMQMMNIIHSMSASQKEQKQEPDLYVKQGQIVCDSDDYEFKVCTHGNTFKKICYKEDDREFEESVIRFFSVEFRYEDTLYQIQLEKEDFNYYVVGNRFTREFFVFYVNHYYEKKIDLETMDNNTKCDVIIIDHTVEVKTIDLTKDKNNYILLLKENYSIVTKLG